MPAESHCGRAQLAGLRIALARTPGVASVTRPQVNPAGDTAVLQVYPTTSPESKSTTDLVNRLRADLPRTAAGAIISASSGVSPKLS